MIYDREHQEQLLKGTKTLSTENSACRSSGERFNNYLDELDLALWKYIPDAEVIGDVVRVQQEGTSG